jgi:hypothetical protein
MENALPALYLVICGSDAVSLARYQVLAAISELPIRICHAVPEAEHLLTHEDVSVRGVVIDIQFDDWHRVLRSLNRVRPDLFAVLFGDPTCCPQPTCVNAVVHDRNLIALLDLVQANWI